VNERDRILYTMTPVELRMYVAGGGSVSDVLQRRLARGEPTVTEWYRLEDARAVRQPKPKPAPAPKLPKRITRNVGLPDPADEGPPIEAVRLTGKAERFASVLKASRKLHVNAKLLLRAAKTGRIQVKGRYWRISQRGAA
jgi:hypothetical protein